MVESGGVLVLLAVSVLILAAAVGTLKRDLRELARRVEETRNGRDHD